MRPSISWSSRPPRWCRRTRSHLDQRLPGRPLEQYPESHIGPSRPSKQAGGRRPRTRISCAGAHGVDTSSAASRPVQGPRSSPGRLAVLTHSRADRRQVRRPAVCRSATSDDEQLQLQTLFAARPSTVGGSRTRWRTRTLGNCRAYNATAWLEIHGHRLTTDPGSEDSWVGMLRTVKRVPRTVASSNPTRKAD